MRERIKGLTEVLRQTLEDGHTHSLGEFNEEVERRIDLTPQQKEITYRRPNYQHSIRKTLSYLVKRGEAIRTDEGKYRKAGN